MTKVNMIGKTKQTIKVFNRLEEIYIAWLLINNGGTYTFSETMLDFPFKNILDVFSGTRGFEFIGKIEVKSLNIDKNNRITTVLGNKLDLKNRKFTKKEDIELIRTLTPGSIIAISLKGDISYLKVALGNFLDDFKLNKLSEHHSPGLKFEKQKDNLLEKISEFNEEGFDLNKLPLNKNELFGNMADKYNLLALILILEKEGGFTLTRADFVDGESYIVSINKAFNFSLINKNKVGKNIYQTSGNIIYELGFSENDMMITLNGHKFKPFKDCSIPFKFFEYVFLRPDNKDINIENMNKSQGIGVNRKSGVNTRQLTKILDDLKFNTIQLKNMFFPSRNKTTFKFRRVITKDILKKEGLGKLDKKWDF